MPEVFLTRKERFSSAHKLFKEGWTNEQNFNVFGKCSSPNWHGHNYELWVTVKGEVDNETGFVVDLNILSKIIKEKIINDLDHKNLNIDVPWLKGINTTTENLAIAIWKRLETNFNNLQCKLHCIKILETENNFVEYYGY